jgi:hypothetical protein
MKIPGPMGNLISGVLLSLLTAGFLIVTQQDEGLSGVNQIIMVMAGMTAMAALTAFQRLVERDRRNSTTHITFNEVLLSKAISEGLPKLEGTMSKVEREAPSSLTPWELTAGQLVGADNALALARLRMDIERELRRIALDTQIDLSLRPFGITALARELVSKEVLPETFMRPLEEVGKICNMAIHGGKVADDIAAGVVRVGGQLLEQLRRLPDLSKPSRGSP